MSKGSTYMARTKRARKATMTCKFVMHAASDNASKEDRSRELPSELIDLISDSLTTKDVARMSVLSKMWEEIWDTQDKLVLDRPFFLGTKITVRRIVKLPFEDEEYEPFVDRQRTQRVTSQALLHYNKNSGADLPTGASCKGENCSYVRAIVSLNLSQVIC